jgi:ribosome recycling factor
VAVRNIRRESVDKIKAAEKDKDIGKDDSKGFQVQYRTSSAHTQCSAFTCPYLYCHHHGTLAALSKKEICGALNRASSTRSHSPFDAYHFSPLQDDLQKSTDDYIKKLDTMLKTKEKDLLTL